MKRLDRSTWRGGNGLRRHGFTLVELAIVLVLFLGVLQLCLPTFQCAKGKARNASVAANLNAVRMGVEAYAGDHGGAVPDVEGPNELVHVLTGTKGYLEQQRFPRPPWGVAATQQIKAVPAAQVATLEPAGHLAPASAASPTPARTILGAARVAMGPFGGSGADALYFGAIAYDRAGKRYVLYGTGELCEAGWLGAKTRAMVCASSGSPADPPKRSKGAEGPHVASAPCCADSDR